MYLVIETSFYPKNIYKFSGADSKIKAENLFLLLFEQYGNNLDDYSNNYIDGLLKDGRYEQSYHTWITIHEIAD